MIAQVYHSLLNIITCMKFDKKTLQIFIGLIGLSVFWVIAILRFIDEGWEGFWRILAIMPSIIFFIGAFTYLYFKKNKGNIKFE
jgi:uncharacterized membrane protein